MNNSIKNFNNRLIKKTMFIISCVVVAVGVFAALSPNAVAFAENSVNNDSATTVYYDAASKKIVVNNNIKETFYTDTYIENAGTKNQKIHNNVILTPDKDYLYDGSIFLSNDGEDLIFRTGAYVDLFCQLDFKVQVKWIDKNGKEEIESKDETKWWFNGYETINFNKHDATDWCEKGGKIEVVSVTAW